MKQFENGDRVRLTIQDKKVQGCPGVVTKVDNNKIQVILELWCRWGTFSNYFPLWFTEDQLEKV